MDRITPRGKGTEPIMPHMSKTFDFLVALRNIAFNVS